MASIITGEVLLLVKAVVAIVLGILIGVGGKIFIKRYLSKWFNKNLLKNEPGIYRSTNLLIKILAETFQWVAILVFFNFGLLQFDIRFLNQLTTYIGANIYTIILFVVIIIFGTGASKIAARRIKEKNIQNADQISLIVEFVILFAFILTGLEIIGIKATPLLDLFRVTLYVIGAIIVVVVSSSLIKGKSSIKKRK